MTPDLVITRADLVSELARARREGQRIGFVPTLGALHEGHASLIEAAHGENDVVVCSIFVNPLQFGDPDDFARYPRDLDADLAIAGEAGATTCFAPNADEMYPEELRVFVDPGPIGEVLEGASRPGHFRGVATVVTKLFALVAPDRAYFGEKDYQQLLIVRRVAQDLSFPLLVVGCPTLREDDGLARSSRNQRLDAASRAAAAVVYRALLEGQRLLHAGVRSRAQVERAMVEVIASEPRATIDYAVAREAQTLEECDELAGEIRLLIAVFVGGVRLIDNIGATL